MSTQDPNKSWHARRSRHGMHTRPHPTNFEAWVAPVRYAHKRNKLIESYADANSFKLNLTPKPKHFMCCAVLHQKNRNLEDITDIDIGATHPLPLMAGIFLPICNIMTQGSQYGPPLVAHVYLRLLRRYGNLSFSANYSVDILYVDGIRA